MKRVEKMEEENLFTREEMMTLTLATIEYRGSATEAEVELVLEWALGARINAALLELVLSQNIVVFPDPADHSSVIVRSRDSEPAP